jgi:hypothetical protein
MLMRPSSDSHFVCVDRGANLSQGEPQLVLLRALCGDLYERQYCCRQMPIIVTVMMSSMSVNPLPASMHAGSYFLGLV